MNPDLKALYQDLILQHNKNPIRFYELDNADEVLEAYNPVCGDRFKVFLKMENNQITEACFKGYGCAISKASTSVMVEQIQGRSLEEAKVLFSKFHKVVHGTLTEGEEVPSDFFAFSAVQSFPGSMPCVLLAWEELGRADDGRRTTDGFLIV